MDHIEDVDNVCSGIWQTIIIGGGPAGLAMAARLREQTPSALFTDEEHRRYHWANKHRQKKSIKYRKTGNKISVASARSCPPHGTLVLDSTGPRWMESWNKAFSAFQITHLRSPMFFHVDPADRDSLLATAQDGGRMDELAELCSCVGKEVTKHTKRIAGRGSRQKLPNSDPEVDERERKDYFSPSRRLFCDHCDDVVKQYGLQDTIHHEEVGNIVYNEHIFTISTTSGATYRAKTVVLAIGPGSVPNYPLLPSLSPMRISNAPQLTHGTNITKFPDPYITSMLSRGQHPTVLVVGGGLTSAQLSDLAIRRGVNKVWHLTRGPLQIKPFDVDLRWMGKYRNYAQARFWSADTDDDRVAMIREARGGGSITPVYNARLKEHVKAGRLELHTSVTLKDLQFDEEGRKWKVFTEPEIQGLSSVDFVYFATGQAVDVDKVGCLQDMVQDHPIPTCKGLPCLTQDLMWKDGVPLFVTGRLAALRLGPGAGNLFGARTGAERIARVIGDSIGTGKEDTVDEEISFSQQMGGYIMGKGSKFSVLGGSECY